MSDKGSFSVKSSHMFVNAPLPEPVKSYFDSSYATTTNGKPKKPCTQVKPTQAQPRTSTDTQVSSGSQTGMAVRTTNMGLSDYY